MASEGIDAAGLEGRYAAALFELADDERALDSVARDLATLKQMIVASADLRRLLRSPVLSRDEQGRAMEAILERAEVSALTRRFVGLVAQNRRLFALSRMIDTFLAELARRRGQVTAEVTAAQPLSDAQLTGINEELRRHLGAKVSVAVTVDPALIGGLVVKVGSRLVDSSVRTKLAKLQTALKRPVGGQV